MMIRMNSRGHWSSPDARSASLELCLDYEKKEVGFDLVVSGSGKYERTRINSFSEALDKFDRASAWVDGVIEELEEDEPDDDFDPFAERFDAVENLLSYLPSKPSGAMWHDYWYDGENILCRTEEQSETIAYFLDEVIGDSVTHTGYYDPKEDERSGEVDDHTGYYYVDFD